MKFILYRINYVAFIEFSDCRKENENEGSRLCAYFQVITKIKKKRRQTIFTVCRLVSPFLIKSQTSS